MHPNTVFDTGIWSEDVIRERAAAYGISSGQYRRSNVLGSEVSSVDVARLVAAMCGTAFAKTTGSPDPDRRRERAGDLTGTLDATQVGGRNC